MNDGLPTLRLERDVEDHLRSCVRSLGGEAYKFVSPQRCNVPDRIIVVPDVEVFFVECKKPGEGATAAQKREHDRLIAKGKTVFVVSDHASINEVIHYITRARFNARERLRRGRA
jgi:hypothetical protein